MEHFVEVETMKDHMITQIFSHLHVQNQTLDDLEEALAEEDASDDDAKDGFIDMEVLRSILKNYGFSFFNFF